MKNFLPELKEQLKERAKEAAKPRTDSFRQNKLFFDFQKEESVAKQIRETLKEKRDPLLRFRVGEVVWSNNLNGFIKIEEIVYELSPYGNDHDYSGMSFDMKLRPQYKYFAEDNSFLLAYSEFLDSRMILVEKERERISRLYDQLHEMEKVKK